MPNDVFMNLLEEQYTKGTYTKASDKKWLVTMAMDKQHRRRTPTIVWLDTVVFHSRGSKPIKEQDG